MGNFTETITHNRAIKLIDRVYDEARRGGIQGEETILQLLDLSDPEQTAYMHERATQLNHEIAQGRGRVAGAIGLDLHPCAMNCGFCSFGEKWGLVSQDVVLSEEQVIGMVRMYVDAGLKQVILRSTEFYDVGTLCDWIRDIRDEVPGAYEIGLNVGELTPEMAYRCYEAGATSAYHVLRMGEGIDTPFDPEVRKRTIEVVCASPLRFTTCIEPIGIEHTNEQVAERMAFAVACRPHGLGIMPRIPVPGTPLGDRNMLGRDRMRQMLAVLRLAAGSMCVYMSMHPDDVTGMEPESNCFTVERGAIPRDTGFSEGEWRGLTAARALEILAEAGLRNESISPDPRFS